MHILSLVLFRIHLLFLSLWVHMQIPPWNDKIQLEHNPTQPAAHCTNANTVTNIRRWPLCTSTSVYGDCPCFSWLNNRFEWHRESWSGVRPNLRGLSPKPLLCVFVNRNMVPRDCLSACQPAVSYMLSASLLHLKLASVRVFVSVNLHLYVIFGDSFLSFSARSIWSKSHGDYFEVCLMCEDKKLSSGFVSFAV